MKQRILPKTIPRSSRKSKPISKRSVCDAVAVVLPGLSCGATGLRWSVARSRRERGSRVMQWWWFCRASVAAQLGYIWSVARSRRERGPCVMQWRWFCRASVAAQLGYVGV